MARDVLCPQGHTVSTDAAAGAQVTCPTCGGAFIVPAAPAPHRAAMPHVPLEALSAMAQRLAPFKRYCLATSRAVLVLGLFIVVLARGCDAVGRRSADAAAARLNLARTEFAEKWDQKRKDYEKEQASLVAIAENNRTDAQKKRLQELTESINKIPADRQAEQEKLDKGDWRSLQETGARNTIAGPGREGWFVFGSLLVIFGLLGVASVTTGPERVLALVLLVVVVMSYFNVMVAAGGRF
jgi:hypothetical protein